MRRSTGLCSLLLVCAAVAAAGCGEPAGRQAEIVVTPATGLYDRARSITITGLRPGSVVSVTATSRRPDGTWSASATFKAPDSGRLDLDRAAPLSGSYRGVSGMGLFWSERFVDRTAASDDGVVVSTVTVRDGRRTLTSTRVRQLLGGRAVSVHPLSVAAQGVAGLYFDSAAGAAPPAGRAGRPAVVLWGGSDGGLGDAAAKAALLAAHGIPSLALAYFDAPGLPCSLENVPIEYFVRAIQWLRGEPTVNPARVWIEADSRGTEPALLLAAQRPDLVHGVIAASPSFVVGGPNAGACPTVGGAAWTLGGAPLQPGQPLPVPGIRGAVMLITGGQNELASSQADADQIVAALPHSGAAHIHLHYPGAGPAVLGIPYGPIPAARVAYGGTIAADAAAYASAWPASIAFVERN
jgi:Acyl-CoA thioester hydrolase/BAAT N-terminal region/BAAT / Acyl-CoA thioester hydrolase C terminal